MTAGGRFTHLDLFAGIGGFSRAVEWLGGETVAFVEWDTWNRRVLAKHWPEAHFHGDIKTLTADVIRGWGIRAGGVGMAHADTDRCRNQCQSSGNTSANDSTGRGSSLAIDLITGGYPCQPFSLAGQRLGAEDDRHLWPEMRRVIDLCRPRFVLAENVSGHVTMGLDTVLSDLEADGYTCGAVVVPACAVNALHRRDRVWIMAHRDSGQRGVAQGDATRNLRRTSGDDRRIPPDGTGDCPVSMADAEGGARVPAIHGGGSGEGRPARLETTGRGGGLPEHGADAALADAGRGDGDGWPGAAGGHDANGPDAGRAQGSGGADQRGEGVSDSGGRRQQPSECNREGSSRSRSTGNASTHDRTGPEIARPLDIETHGLPAGLVRRLAAGPAEPDLIRAAWADGSWEWDLPRVVSEEPERRQKLQAAGNAIVPIVAYEILRVMLGSEDLEGDQ